MIYPDHGNIRLAPGDEVQKSHRQWSKISEHNGVLRLLNGKPHDLAGLAPGELSVERNQVGAGVKGQACT